MSQGLSRIPSPNRRLQLTASLALGMLLIVSGPARAGPITSPNEILTDLRRQAPRTEVERQFQDIVATDLTAGDYAKALFRLTDLRSKPEAAADERADFLLTVAYYGLGRLDEALTAIDRRLAERPGWLIGLWLRAAVLIRQGKLDEAEGTHDRAVRAAPREPGGYYQRGLFLTVYRASAPAKLTAAVADLNMALQLGAPGGDRPWTTGDGLPPTGRPPDGGTAPAPGG